VTSKVSGRMVSPGLTWMAVITPVQGEGASMMALAVSKASKGAFCSTVSPGLIYQVRITASRRPSARSVSLSCFMGAMY